MAFKNATSGRSIVTLDGKWLDVNDKLCSIIGYSKDELINSYVLDHTHYEDQAKIAFLFQNKSFPFISDKLVIDIRLNHKNGNSFWVAFHISMLNKMNEPYLFLIDVFDVSS